MGLSRVSSAGGTPQTLTTPDPASQEGHTPLAPGPARGQGHPVHGAQRVGQLRRREPRRAHARRRHEEGAASRRISWPLPSERPPGLHSRRHALRRAFRSRSAGADGRTRARARERERQPGNCGEHSSPSPATERSCTSGERACLGTPIQWMDREGKLQPLRAATGRLQLHPLLPRWPEARAGDPSRARTGTCGSTNGSATPFLVSRSIPACDRVPVWTPDGRRIAFSSTRADQATGKPLLAASRRDGRGGAPDGEQEPAIPEFVASEREVPGLPVSSTLERASTS